MLALVTLFYNASVQQKMKVVLKVSYLTRTIQYALRARRSNSQEFRIGQSWRAIVYVLILDYSAGGKECLALLDYSAEVMCGD